MSGIEFDPLSVPAWKGCPEDRRRKEVRCNALHRLAGAAPHLILLPPTKKDKMLVQLVKPCGIGWAPGRSSPKVATLTPSPYPCSCAGDFQLLSAGSTAFLHPLDP